jgi:hypothetical protein
MAGPALVIFTLIVSAVSAAATLGVSGVRRKNSYTAAEEHLCSAPVTPFKNFSDSYVKRALATPTDWVEKGAVTPVKDQGAHGYCGTFGRVGQAEGQFMIKTGPLVSFAEEMLVDCVGWDNDQYSFFAPLGFMPTALYPYNTTGPDMDPPIPGNPCRYNTSDVVQGTNNFLFNGSSGQAPDEAQMAAFIHHNGPVSAGIGADIFSLLNLTACEKDESCFVTQEMCTAFGNPGIDHSVTVVGYGTDSTKGDFWLIKNSWSTKWANKGFVKVARGMNCASMCTDSSICGNVFTIGDPTAYFE